MGLEQDIQGIQDLTQRSSSTKSKAYEKLKQLQEKIKHGESTEDTIKDFVIVNLGTISPEVEQPYRDMETRLKGQTGNQILVIKQDESIHGCPGIVASPYIDPMFIGIDTTLRLGILTNGLEVDIQKGNLVFPTEKHVEKYDRYRGKWKSKEGPIELSWYDFMNLGKEVSRRMTPMPNDLSAKWEHGLMIHVGEEVEQYFRGKEWERAFDISYVEALNLLRQEIPTDFKEKYDSHVYQKRVGIIDRLEQLTKSETELNREIKSVYGSMKGGGFMRGGAITVVEDEDDARVVTMGTRMKLKETREQIQSCLKQAIELGMHRGNLKLESKPGVVIEVPKYISSMCENYEIDLTSKK